MIILEFDKWGARLSIVESLLNSISRNYVLIPPSSVMSISYRLRRDMHNDNT